MFLFQMLAETEEAQIYILKAIYDLWSSHQQVDLQIADLFLSLNCKTNKDRISKSLFSVAYEWAK